MYIRPENHQNGCLSFHSFKGVKARGQNLQFWGAPKNACFCRQEAKVDQRSPPSMEGGDL